MQNIKSNNYIIFHALIFRAVPGATYLLKYKAFWRVTRSLNIQHHRIRYVPSRIEVSFFLSIHIVRCWIQQFAIVPQS